MSGIPAPRLVSPRPDARAAHEHVPLTENAEDTRADSALVPLRPTDRFLKYDWSILHRTFPALATPATPATRFVVQVPTLFQGRHASPAVIARRIVEAFGGDMQRAKQQVHLVVGVNRRDRLMSTEFAADVTLASLRMQPDNTSCLPGAVRYTSWRPRWEGPGSTVATGVSFSRVRQHARAHKNDAEVMASAEDTVCAQPPVGMLRTEIAKVARQHQEARHAGERVFTLVTDADTTFPVGFFDAIAALPPEARWVSGGYAYDHHATPTMHLQNAFDMHLRSYPPLDKRLVYHPEPCLIVDTSRLNERLYFGDSTLESRHALRHYQNVTGPLPADAVKFIDTLRVTTHAGRFDTGASIAGLSFAQAIATLAKHPQSHAGTFTWTRQLAAALGTSTESVGTVVSLFSIPALLQTGLPLALVPDYLDHAVCETVGAPTNPALQSLGLHPAQDAQQHAWVVGQTRLWADAQLDFIERRLLAPDTWPALSPEAALSADLKAAFKDHPRAHGADATVHVQAAFHARILLITAVRQASSRGQAWGASRSRESAPSGQASTPLRPLIYDCGKAPAMVKQALAGRVQAAPEPKPKSPADTPERQASPLPPPPEGSAPPDGDLQDPTWLPGQQPERGASPECPPPPRRLGPHDEALVELAELESDQVRWAKRNVPHARDRSRVLDALDRLRRQREESLARAQARKRRRT